MASAKFVEMERIATEACKASLDTAVSSAEARAEASAEAAAVKAASEMSDVASRLAEQQHRNDVLEGMVQDAEEQRKKEVELSAFRYSQLVVDTQNLLHEHTATSKHLEESMRSSLEEERQRVSEAEARAQAAMERIIELKAEAAQREARMAALEAEVRRLINSDRYVHDVPYLPGGRFSLCRHELSQVILLWFCSLLFVVQDFSLKSRANVCVCSPDVQLFSGDEPKNSCSKGELYTSP